MPHDVTFGGINQAGALFLSLSAGTVGSKCGSASVPEIILSKKQGMPHCTNGVDSLTVSRQKHHT